MTMTTKEWMAWGMLFLTTAAGATAGYIGGGWVGCLTAISGGGGVASAILGVQAKTATPTTKGP